MKHSEYKKLPLETQLANANMSIRALLFIILIETLILIF